MVRFGRFRDLLDSEIVKFVIILFCYKLLPLGSVTNTLPITATDCVLRMCARVLRMCARAFNIIESAKLNIQNETIKYFTILKVLSCLLWHSNCFKNHIFWEAYCGALK